MVCCLTNNKPSSEPVLSEMVFLEYTFIKLVISIKQGNSWQVKKYDALIYRVIFVTKDEDFYAFAWFNPDQYYREFVQIFYMHVPC